MNDISVGMSGGSFVSAINQNTTWSKSFFNVKEYGALGDGVADDTVAIQNTINACFNAGGGTVYFPNGVYIIGGSLQNLPGINANSQLYIPSAVESATEKKSIRLLGESTAYFPIFPFATVPSKSTKGAVLLSTIQGSGDRPSVIASKSVANLWGNLNYTDTIIDTLDIRVSAGVGNGPTMSAINMLYSSITHIHNVFCGVDSLMASTVFPTAETFGVIMSPNHCNIVNTVDKLRCHGFNVGLAIGEAVAVNVYVAWGCHIGLMGLTNSIASTCKNIALHACNYAIGARTTWIDNYHTGYSHLDIDYFSLEPRDPVNNSQYWADWMAFEDVIYDPNNYLTGHASHLVIGTDTVQGKYVTRSHGGVNMILRNAYNNSGDYWSTADRPTNRGLGLTGYNTTTNKLEVWNGTSWNDLY